MFIFDYNQMENIDILAKRLSQVRINKGTGAGGTNTNRNGNILEEKVRNIIKNNFFRQECETYKKTKHKYQIEKVKRNDKIYIRAPENAFSRWEKTNGNGFRKLGGAKNPDELLINEESKTINWLECKSQKGSGSVIEKLQSGTKKIRNLKRRFPDWNINYCYILDNYFKGEPEIDELDEDGISYIWEDDSEFQKNLINLIK